MTIGIDIRVLARGTRTGIEEYVLNLLPRLLPLDKKIKYKLFYNAFKKVKLDYSWLKLPNVKLEEFRFPNRFLDFFTQTLKYPTIDKFLGKIDIFFSPHFLPISLSKKCKRVITFHDLSFEHHPQFFSSSRKIWHFLTFPKKQAMKADKIIADSQSTKEDLVKIYRIDPTKVEVVYLGISQDFKPINKNNHQFEKVKKVEYDFSNPETLKTLDDIKKEYQDKIDQILDEYKNQLEKVNNLEFGKAVNSQDELMKLSDVELMARVIYAEQATNLKGQNAVAWNIINKSKGNFRSVLTASKYSCLKGEGGNLQAFKPDVNSKGWENALQLAIEIQAGESNNIPNDIGDATEFRSKPYFDANSRKDGNVTYLKQKGPDKIIREYKVKNVKLIGGNVFFDFDYSK